jgi:hypothetical protein
LYVAARDALEDLDPDEVNDPVLEHRSAGDLDRAAVRAAGSVAESWEGTVAVGSIIVHDPRFRGFCWAAAAVRHLEVEVTPAQFSAWSRGEALPGMSIDDTALYALLPALTGLGPELPDEAPGPCPATGTWAWQAVGLPEADWQGIDPLDGLAVTPEACAAALPGAIGVWRELLVRGVASGGLLVREDTLDDEGLASG